MFRVNDHPILGKDVTKEMVTIFVDGKPIAAIDGEPIAAALLANNIRVCRNTPRKREPRGVFCGIGQCTDCVMEVDGIANVRTCITPIKAGMLVNTQEGVG